MPKLLSTKLDLRRCPHCNVDTPNLSFIGQHQLADIEGQHKWWRLYSCGRCGGLVTATATQWDAEVTRTFPSASDVSTDIPERARAYLDQAINSLGAPAGAVMLAASAVDAMLKVKNLSNGSLYARIEEAAKLHLITPEMSEWAHDVRLDANDQRHADQAAPLPTTDQAQKCIDFASALGQILFVLPARVERGIANAKGVPPNA